MRCLQAIASSLGSEEALTAMNKPGAHSGWVLSSLGWKEMSSTAREQRVFDTA